MTKPQKYPPAYPPRYYQERTRSLGCLILPLGLLISCVVGFIFVLCTGVGGVGQVVGLVLTAVLLYSVVQGTVTDYRKVRIIPFYDQPLPEANTFLSGHALARNCLRLDRLADQRHLRSISAFGFSDPLRGEPNVWHDAAAGLATVAGLLEALRDAPGATDDDRAVSSDLEKIRNAFEQARQKGIRFGFLVELGNYTSGQVWDVRKGYV